MHISAAYFHSLTELSWLAEATIPVTGDCAKAETMFSWAEIVMLLFSAMFQSSKDLHPKCGGEKKREKNLAKPELVKNNMTFIKKKKKRTIWHEKVTSTRYGQVLKKM